VALVDSLGSDSTNTVAAEPAEGDSLVPPLAPNNTASTAKSSAPRTNESRKMVFHTVQKGDTLWKIANKYKISTVDEIMGLNGLKKNYKLVPGTKLKVGYSG
jgi:LysM repeat protein